MAVSDRGLRVDLGSQEPLDEALSPVVSPPPPPTPKATDTVFSPNCYNACRQRLHMLLVRDFLSPESIGASLMCVKKHKSRRGHRCRHRRSDKSEDHDKCVH
ncbi:hypothetical protein CSUI_007556 [Cystoisospora suis]|uniref:Uncharacterized protein n=1 Tax=Cystoisospora suis TaxID=483139 RepID=A0A2C6KPS7_9APIC|nr:hypothetical protein CSUI_007556 [Cystoisospora suis]